MTGTPDPRAVTIDRDVCHLVTRFTHRLEAHARKVGEEFGLTASQVVALRELSEPITARELAARMTCEPSNATYVLDRLEEQGLLARRPHPNDRRAKQIVLTAAGVRRRDEVLDRLGADAPLAALAAADQETLRTLLRALVPGS